MNVAKFQLVLNHDDLDVICKGLQEFSATVLKEHEAEDSFGYYGRPRYNDASVVLTPSLPASVVGLLHAYLTSSPQIEELFIVWSLVDRSSNSNLCAALNRCIAVILHCAHSLENICNDVVNRILHEFWRNITAMLDSNNTELVHSCLALLVSMCRTSKNNSDQVLQKLNLSDNTFTSMIQKGKSKQTGLMTPSEQPVTVDSRMLLVILIFTMMLRTNETGLERILGSNSIVKKIMHGLTKDASVSLELMLNSVLFLIDQSSVVRSHLLDIVDAGCIDKLLNLFQSEDGVMQSIAESFFDQLVELCAKLLQSNDSHAYVVRGCLLNMVKLLKPQKDRRHRKLQVSVLSAVPFLLHQSLSSDSFNWSVIGSVVNAEYTSMLRHLTHVLTVTPLDVKQKDSLKQKISSWDSINKKNQSTQSAVLVQELMTSLLPSGLTKIELTKLLSHPSTTVSVTALQLIRAVLHRLQRLLSDAGISRVVFQRITASGFCKWLPDLSAVLDLTLKSVKNGSGTASSHENTDVASVHAAQVMQDLASDDFDFNFLGTGAQGTSITTASAMKKAANSVPMDVDGDLNAVEEHISVHEVGLEVMALYVSLLSSNTSSSGGGAGASDILKLLNETVSWSAEMTSEECLTKVESELSPDVLTSIITVLKRVAGSVSWFGHKNDAYKAIASLAQNKGMPAVYQLPLSKLLLLCASSEKSLSDDGVTLLKQVLLSSGLFAGHGQCDFELHCEAQCWLRIVTLNPTYVPLLSMVLSTAYHYAADLCCTFMDATPLSSLSLALLLFSVGDFSVFASDFSKQLQIHLAGNFQVSYDQRELYQSLMMDWLNIVLTEAPEPLKYLTSLRAATKHVASLSDSALITLSSIITNYVELLSMSHDLSSAMANAVTRLCERVTINRLKDSDRYTPAHIAYAVGNIHDLIDENPGTNSIVCALHQHWHLISRLYLSTTSEDIKYGVVQFMTKRWQSDLLSVSSNYERLLVVHNAVKLAQILLNRPASKTVSTTRSASNTSGNKKRKNSDMDESADDSATMLKTFCSTMIEGLIGLLVDAVASQSLSSVLSSVTMSVLQDHCLESNLFGEWSRQVLLKTARACVGTKQLHSFWQGLAATLGKHCNSSDAANLKVFTELCVAVYKCSASFDLRVALIKLNPNALKDVEDDASALQSVSIEEFLGRYTSLMEARIHFAELLLQPVRISEDGAVAEHLQSNTVNRMQVELLVPDTDKLLGQFKDNDDVAATLRFIQSGYPSILKSYRCGLSSLKESKVHSKQYPILVSVVSLMLGGFHNVTGDELTRFWDKVALSTAKGKLLTALQGLTALMNVAVKSSPKYKLIWVEFTRQYIAEYRQFNDRLLIDDLLSQPLKKLTDLVDDSEPSDLTNLWIIAFSSVLKLYLSVSTNTLIKAQSNDHAKVMVQIGRVQQLLLLPQVAVNCPVNNAVSLHAELSKWVKCCLKFEVDNGLVLTTLSQLMSVLSSSPSDCILRKISVCEDPSNDGNALHAPVLFNMLAGHSKVTDVLLGHNQNSKCEILRLLIILLRITIRLQQTSELKDALVFLATPLWVMYKGTTSVLDQLVLRFFHLLEAEGIAGVLLQSMRVSAPFSLVEGKMSLSDSWLFEWMIPPMVYATLSSFDITRGVTSVPFSWETSITAVDISEESTAGASYDISYLLPVIFTTLRNFDVSIRRLTNCGAVSVVLVGLSSTCPTTRSYALASLHLIYLLLHKQTPEVDPSFRERAQLLYLISWLKNSILPAKERKNVPTNGVAEVPSVPPLIGIFIARAVLNIMQSNHELYSVINKYLLSRPWCDLSDVPLLDFLLNQSDSQTQVSERLAVLRLLRDGLISSQDHSNLCRKNGFNRLMLMFCIHSTDVRIGYAILDVIERGLLIKQSAKYLIERCDVLCWLHSIAVNSASKYRLKAMSLMRSVIGYGYVVSVEEESLDAVQQVQKLLLDIAQSWVQCSSVEASPELLRLLLLCMWDMSLMFEKQGWFEGWNTELLLSLYDTAVEKKLSADFLQSIVCLGAYIKMMDDVNVKLMSDLILNNLLTNGSVSNKTEDTSSSSASGYDNVMNHSSESIPTNSLWKCHAAFPYKISSQLPSSCDSSLTLHSSAAIIARCSETRCEVKMLQWAVCVWQMSDCDGSLEHLLNLICLRVSAHCTTALDWIEDKSVRVKVLGGCKKLLQNVEEESDSPDVRMARVGLLLGFMTVSSWDASVRWSDLKNAAHASSSLKHWIERVDKLV